MRQLCLAIALVLLPNLSYATVENLTQLISDSRNLALDAASPTRQRFTDTQITTYLNQAQRQMLDSSYCLEGNTTFNTAVGQQFYAMPSNFISISRAIYGGNEISQLSPQILDMQNNSWTNATGKPSNYFVNFSSRGLVGFYPIPDVSSNTATASIDYFMDVTDLVNGTDLPFGGISELSDFQPALEYYSASIMRTIDGDQQGATNFMTIYTGMSAVMKNRCLKSPNILPNASFDSNGAPSK